MIKVNNVEVEINRFPDGTLNLKANPFYDHEIVIITWNYHDDAEFLAVAFLTKFYQARNNKVNLYLPYVPNARMDRVENADNIFAMKYFGELINSLGFESVWVMDTHSSVTNAVIKNCRAIPVEPIITDVIHSITEKNDGELLIFFPDEGAMKRYSKSIDDNIPFAFGMKKRDWNTGNILGLDILGVELEDIKGKTILIRDDICSKGGTFYYAAKKLKEMGAGKIYLFITHCENSIHNGEFGDDKVNLCGTGLIEHVFTTDSTYSLGSSDWISVIKTSLNNSESAVIQQENTEENEEQKEV